MSAGRPVAGMDPVLEPFIEWSQSLHWSSVPLATRQMVKRELLDYQHTNKHANKHTNKHTN